MDMPRTARKSPTTLKSTPLADSTVPVPDLAAAAASRGASPPPREIGGTAGPEPTRFGDWEKNGRCIDF
jgi:hypothetical protein